MQTVGEKDQRLVIVNLQRTPLDPLAKLLIHAKCDDVSKLLMTKLGLPIPQFTLKRSVRAERLPGRFVISMLGRGSLIPNPPQLSSLAEL